MPVRSLDAQKWESCVGCTVYFSILGTVLAFRLFVFRYVNPAFCKAFLWLSRGSHQWNDVCCVPLYVSWTEILVFQQAGKDKLLKQKPNCVLEIKSDPCHVETTCRTLCSSTEASVFETASFFLFCLIFFFFPLLLTVVVAHYASVCFSMPPFILKIPF